MQRNSTNQKQSLEYLQRASGLMHSEWETSRDLASKLIDHAIQLDPNNFQGYLYRARLSYNRYLDIKKAIDDLKVALEIVQNDELLTEEIDIPYLYYDLYFYSIRMTEKISNEILLDYMTKSD